MFECKGYPFSHDRQSMYCKPLSSSAYIFSAFPSLHSTIAGSTVSHSLRPPVLLSLTLTPSSIYKFPYHSTQRKREKREIEKMSTFINSILLTSNTHPYIIGLTLFTLALFLSLALIAASLTNLHTEYDPENHTPIFINEEFRPLLLEKQDPLKDYPCGRFVTRTVSAKRAKKQAVNRAVLRKLLEADWAESEYGSIARGPRVGEKRKMGVEGLVGKGKRIRVEESEDCEW